MSLIIASDLTKSYGADDIFVGISMDVPPQSRTAIVGPNGIGKTTLLRVLIGQEAPSEGEVHTARDLDIGYLPQEAGISGSHTLWEECLRAVSELTSMEAELARLERAMAVPEQVDQALSRYGRLQETFERMGGYSYENHIRQTLSGLGFEAGDYHRPLSQLSGGERTRAALAYLLLSDPDLLVLDEPTNHLDIAAVEWLESYLRSWEGAALIVSHDRYFLDKVVNHIWEMSEAGLEIYRGNYSAYLEQRQERWDLRQQLFVAEKERLEKELDYIKRNIAGQNTLQAKGRLKRLSRYLEAIERAGLQAIQGKKWSQVSLETGASSQMMGVAEVEARIQELRNPVVRPPQLSMQLKANRRSGDLVLRTYDVDIGYQDEGQALFHAPDLTLKRGECAAIIGPNGAGKTTFLKTLLGEIPPLSGEIDFGASLNVAYFAQAHEDLVPERTLVDEILATAPGMRLGEVRSYLARFLFTGDEVFKQVQTLSGGERGRLALAKLSLTDANLLLLDEPTNHLDIPSQEVLQGVLADYRGTILLVSHDRYLINALGTQIWEIEPDETSMRVFKGSYSQYRAQKDSEQEQEAARQAQEMGEKANGSPAKRASISEWQRQTRIQEIEEEVSYLEAQLSKLSKKLEDPPANPEQVQQMGEDYVQTQHQIEALMAEWEGLHTAVDRT